MGTYIRRKSARHRKRRFGFRTRMKTRGGRGILKRQRRVKRKPVKA